MAITGGKEVHDADAIFRRLDRAKAKYDDMVLVHGGGPGVERIAAQWAERNGVHQVVCKPDWNAHGRAAPFRRNDELLNLLPKGVHRLPGLRHHRQPRRQGGRARHPGPALRGLSRIAIRVASPPGGAALSLWSHAPTAVRTPFASRAACGAALRGGSAAPPSSLLVHSPRPPRRRERFSSCIQSPAPSQAPSSPFSPPRASSRSPRCSTTMPTVLVTPPVEKPTEHAMLPTVVQSPMPLVTRKPTTRGQTVKTPVRTVVPMMPTSAKTATSNSGEPLRGRAFRSNLRSRSDFRCNPSRLRSLRSLRAPLARRLASLTAVAGTNAAQTLPRLARSNASASSRRCSRRCAPHVPLRFPRLHRPLMRRGGSEPPRSPATISRTSMLHAWPSLTARGGFGSHTRRTNGAPPTTMRTGAMGMPSGTTNHTGSMPWRAGNSAIIFARTGLRADYCRGFRGFTGSVRRGNSPVLVGLDSLLRVRAFWSHAPLRSPLNARKLIARISA